MSKVPLLCRSLESALTSRASRNSMAALNDVEKGMKLDDLERKDCVSIVENVSGSEFSSWIKKYFNM
jgi:hypothetical protein